MQFVDFIFAMNSTCVGGLSENAKVDEESLRNEGLQISRPQEELPHGLGKVLRKMDCSVQETWYPHLGYYAAE